MKLSVLKKICVLAALISVATLLFVGCKAEKTSETEYTTVEGTTAAKTTIVTSTAVPSTEVETTQKQAEQPTTIAVTEKITEEPTEQEFEDWKQLYIDFLYSDLGQAYKYATLVYLNDDSIPEMVIQSDYMISGNRLCWIDNGKVVNEDLGTLGAVTCSERNGLLIVDGLNHGITFKVVYNFNGNSINRLHLGRMTDTGDCYWDEISVSYDELQTHLSEFSDYYRPEMMEYSQVIPYIENY